MVGWLVGWWVWGGGGAGGTMRGARRKPSPSPRVRGSRPEGGPVAWLAPMRIWGGGDQLPPRVLARQRGGREAAAREAGGGGPSPALEGGWGKGPLRVDRPGLRLGAT